MRQFLLSLLALAATSYPRADAADKAEALGAELRDLLAIGGEHLQRQLGLVVDDGVERGELEGGGGGGQRGGDDHGTGQGERRPAGEERKHGRGLSNVRVKPA